MGEQEAGLPFKLRCSLLIPGDNDVLAYQEPPLPAVTLYCSSEQDFKPPIHMSDSDFVSLTANTTRCDANGCIGLEAFDRIMRQQLTAYTQAILSRSQRATLESV